MKKILLIFFSLIVILFFSGCSDSSTEYHHIFPQQFRNWFLQKGIDVDKYTIAITKKDHRTGNLALHKTQWNREWYEWIRQHPNATKSEILYQVEKMLRKRGFVGLIKLYDYRTKQPVGELKLIGSGFFGIFARLGSLILKIFGANSKISVFLVWLGSAVASMFGLRVSSETAAGIGLITVVVFISIAAYVSYIYPDLWIWFLGTIGIIFGFIESIEESIN
ncbi:DUF2380 domain-containing protein [Caminibacter pacificus]|nr:DUF2380 domain-containing protein [Caminibacter pacificus]